MPDVTAMPETNAPNKIVVKFSVPADLYEQARELAAAEGWTAAELDREFWVRGFGLYAEESNKRLVNKKLRRQEGSSE